MLLLGTDSRFYIQDAAEGYPQSRYVVPGRSYLVTVVDPDRNVYPSARDTVLVSAEVSGGGGEDVEVYVISETEENSGVFRGFVNSSPGFGREVQGLLECMPLQEIRFAYVDVADARGRRNPVSQIRLPVIAAVMTGGKKGLGQ